MLEHRAHVTHTQTNTEIQTKEHRDTGEGNTQQSLSSRSYGEENNNHAECCTGNNLPLSVKKNKEQLFLGGGVPDLAIWGPKAKVCMGALNPAYTTLLQNEDRERRTHKVY